MSEKSAYPAFWDERYQSQILPWDAGEVPIEFIAFAQTLTPTIQVLIPGCGSGYEVGYLAEAGVSVLGIDFSPVAVAHAQTILGQHAQHLHCTDFFALPSTPFDWVYERAFLCALPRSRRIDWAQKMTQLIKPGGVLAGYFFIADTESGPPFGLAAGELATLLGTAFVCEQDQPCMQSSAVFAFTGSERWQVWRRVIGL